MNLLPHRGRCCCSWACSVSAQREVSMALYHVSLAGMNTSKIVRTLGAAELCRPRSPLRRCGNDADVVTLCSLAIMISTNFLVCPEGRVVLMDGGTLDAVVRLMQQRALSSS